MLILATIYISVYDKKTVHFQSLVLEKNNLNKKQLQNIETIDKDAQSFLQQGDLSSAYAKKLEIASLYYDAKQYSDARSFAADIFNEIRNSDLEKVVANTLKMKSLTLIAKTWKAEKQYEDAIVAYEKAAKFAVKIYGAGSSESGKIYSGLASLYKSLKNDKMFLFYQNKALECALTDPHFDQNKLAISYNNIGEAYRTEKDMIQAIHAFEQSIRVIEQEKGATAPELAIPLNNLGLAYMVSGDFTLAETYLRRAMEMMISFQGKSHPSTLKVYANLKKLLTEQNRNSEAAKLETMLAKG
jgi:tetratricopeptide (TPR) repeat protein